MPSLFSHLIGNDHLKALFLQLLIKQKIPFIVLFEGTDGIGKSLFALSIAQRLVGNSKKDHPDIHILYPDSKTQLHSIQSIRLLLKESGLPPFEGSVKCFIIHDIEKMLLVSSNALLKVLEEPPERTYFFLLTSQIRAVLPTIISRATKFSFAPISEKELSTFLLPKFSLSEVERVCHSSGGSIKKALYHLSFPSTFIENFFQARSYRQLCILLNGLQQPSEENVDQTVDQIFEEMLQWIGKHFPFVLTEAFEIVQHARTLIQHHVKLKTVLEIVFLRLKQEITFI